MTIYVSQRQADLLILALTMASQTSYCDVNTKKGEDLYDQIVNLKEQIALQTKSQML